MLNLTRATALATVLGCLALASPAFASPFPNDTPSGVPNSAVNLDQSGHVVSTTPDTSMGAAPEAATGGRHHHMGMKTAQGHGDMREHVEERIQKLHDKLGITKEQEPAWNDVAQAMRDSEANVITLIQERHQNATNMNAVDDMDSYQKIAQAHADGLKNVNVAFSKLYGDMNDTQKKNADVIFSKWEGHDGHHMMKKTSATTKAPKATK